MSLSRKRVTLEGTTTLLMHNGELANPLSEGALALKKLTGIRNKTPEVYQQIADTEWKFGLYVNGDGRIHIPGHMLDALVRDGGKRSKNGKTIVGGLLCEDGDFSYEGSKKVDVLERSGKSRFTTTVVIKRSRTVRTRPAFFPWSVVFIANIDLRTVSEEVFAQALHEAETIGLGDWRPRFGRFRVVSIEAAD